MMRTSILQAGALGWGVLSVAGSVLHAPVAVIGIALAAGIITQLNVCGGAHRLS